MAQPLEPPADEPPPIDPSDRIDDSEELEDWELGISFDSSVPLDGDDGLEGEANQLETGVDLEELAGKDEEADSALDLGSEAAELLPIEDLGNADDPERLDSASMEGLPDLDNLPLGDDEEGPDSNLAELGVPELPALELEDETQSGLDPKVLPDNSLSGDEPRPLAAASLWSELASGLSLEACGALTLAEGVVVAASSDLFWFSSGSLTPLRLEAGSSRIHSLALCRTAWEYAICATAGGRLFRRGRLSSSSEELRHMRDSVSRGVGGPESLQLCQLGPGYPHTLLVRTARGELLRSDDDGFTFRPVTERKIRALSQRGSPAVALTFDGTLLKSDDCGGTFTELHLPSAVRSLLDGEEPLLAASGDLILVAEQNAGLTVSSDNGQTFVRVPGTGGVSAVCAADWNGNPTAWAALHDAMDRSWIVRVDPTTGHAETISSVDRGNAQDDDSFERARIARIEWEPTQGRLWLAGGFGVKILAPP